MERPTGVAQTLLRWYDGNRRDLPWRRRPSPYRTLVSELMLQQTVVKTVVRRFEIFVARFPDACALAGAPADAVLALWSGLGYYARARNLHAAAREIVRRHGGRVPRTEAELRGLPGVGEYTAAAVASIAYGARTFALDGNAARVVARLHAVPGPAGAPAARRRLRALGQEMMPVDRAGDFMQAVMDLGATVCVPGRPRCGACPLRASCRAHAAGRAEDIPPPRVRSRRRSLRLACAMVERGGRVLLVRRHEGQLFAGTWALPAVEVSSRIPDEQAARHAVEAAGVTAASLRPAGHVHHTLTHRQIDARVFVVEGSVAPGRLRGVIWATRAGLGRLALSTFARKTLGVGGFLPVARAGRD